MSENGIVPIECAYDRRLWNDAEGNSHCVCNGAGSNFNTETGECTETTIDGCNLSIDGACAICFLGAPENDGANCSNAELTCEYPNQFLTTAEESCDDNLCGETCHFCADGSTCVTCASPYMVANSGTCECAPGFFGADCERCIDKCSECADNATCTTCFNGFTFDSEAGACVPERIQPAERKSLCPSGQYLAEVVNGDITEEVCEPCDESCSECEGTATNCTACNGDGNYALFSNNGSFTCECSQGYYYDSNLQVCSSCEVENCLQCSAKNLCDICSDNTTLNVAFPNACPAVEEFAMSKLCPDGFYLND
jgi:hypothetical protein